MITQLIELRYNLNLSQKAIAIKMGYTQSKIAKLESGKIKLTIKDLELYAKALSLKVTITLDRV